ncbi:MAG: hypothetical protein IT323_12025, partial [Anaerolineae bacterium]|nr:hypothetical protein [Anaerolineae bacterium]
MLAHRSHTSAALVALALVIVSVLSLAPGVTGAQPPVEPPLPIIDAAIADLGQRLARPLARGLNVQFEYTWQQFPDASLGCPQPGQMYAQVVTPGYSMRITVRNEVYDYRASEDGAILLLCGRIDAQGTPQPLDVTPPATPALTPTTGQATATPIVIAPLGTETPPPTPTSSVPLEPVAYDPALAYVGADGNVYVTAFRDGPGTPLTGDANRRATQEFPFFAEDRDYGLLRWSPGGERLLFVDHKDGTLYLAVSGQAPAPVARGLEPGLPPAWSPDGAEFVIGVPTDVTLDGGAHMVQLQAFPANGGAPRYAGEFALKGCSSQIDDPTWALYQDETGPAGGNDVLRWTPDGYVHSLGCGGQGLALTGFDNLTVWQADDVVRPAIAPDGARAAAIRPAVEGAPAALVILDLRTGQIT